MHRVDFFLHRNIDWEDHFDTLHAIRAHGGDWFLIRPKSKKHLSHLPKETRSARNSKMVQ